MATEGNKAMDPAHLRFEFILRHIDDEPTIGDHQFLHETATGIIETALNFAVIGEVDGATKLLGALVNRGFDLFQFSDREYPFLKPCMFFAWDATSSWPSWIPEEDRTEERLQELEANGRKPWLERFSEEWEVTEETANKAMDMAYNGIVTVLPSYDGTLAGQVFQAELMWKNGDFSFAANPNGPLTIRYAKLAMWWRQGIYPYPFVQVYRTAGLAIALDIYLRLGKEDEARDTFEKICGRFHSEEQVEQLACSRIAWKKLLVLPERPILDILNIHAAKLRPAVTRAVQMAEDRLENGPRRRYGNKSIEQLANIVSENTFLNCPYDTLNVYRPPGRARVQPENPSGLLRPACSPSGIAALEERLGVTLPQDYKEFLGVTNGLGSMWNGQNLVDYLVSVEDVCWEDLDFVEGTELPLLRDVDPSLRWPEIGKARSICLSGDINNQDTNGFLFLVGPEIVQPAKDYFFTTYEERNESQKRELDRLVEETYGSMETLRGLDYALISWTAWNFTYYPYNGIRDFLEQMAEAALCKERPWLNIFEPSFRQLA
ncbi:hypothetical protein FSARC_9331 [Fusarium sarcochroum]|uniref:Knr4/Smi1-like domain-containing protein n=1 Tax=Fusarium sarcochroum TaxID=1208366 RepID=A0A8H4X5E2_9HYPO|nr:hypothetical protein FSARC_9331 [Fusarium sarcochroum]